MIFINSQDTLDYIRIGGMWDKKYLTIRSVFAIPNLSGVYLEKNKKTWP